MAEWCLAHPWMTFFIALSLLNSPFIVIKTIRKERR